MNSIAEEFNAVKLTRMQRFLAVFTLVVLILANTRPTESKYYQQIGGAPANYIDMYVMSVFTDGDRMVVGAFGKFFRVK